MEQQQRISQKWTIKDILEWTTAFFKKRGIRTARLDAEVLLAFCLSVDRLFLYLNFERPLSPSERMNYRELVRRRAMREPVSLIIGKKEFWSRTFKAVSGVLIPRPDTEILVEATLRALATIESPRLLEIGTGSGAISIVVALENPAARIVATDIDPLALDTAQENAALHGVASAITFVLGDLYAPFKEGERFHLICSNPPYIPTEVIATLEPEIDYEPLLALDGGPDGLNVIRRIADGAPDFLLPGGSLLMEIGPDQEMQARTILEQTSSFVDIRITQDLAGRPRVVTGRLSP
ncbi:peptide chain release factor N(5)-glutamine methyltransferase [Desulfomonile tiedjei]|uniref:Release factor glutamine methyltransferase n=1 Tax=Desulfomonile tiedjei (strain ATCC 49306 / DSM 6799 / DCB-1) TaxID=706587 RepID=I4CAK2_DESTA|nr:peptide chain release factor N(5)-glutamine methyltransferase [Desulfomonile tiedjei]AFM26593.1 protein-(glutamine-N5) methyltransferase, release factor-specific [Desulfomonile tiedjei DSM 6799]